MQNSIKVTGLLRSTLPLRTYFAVLKIGNGLREHSKVFHEVYYEWELISYHLFVFKLLFVSISKCYYTSTYIVYLNSWILHFPNLYQYLTV